MKTIGSPANISILLHCHTNPHPLRILFPDSSLDQPLIELHAVRDLVAIGAIAPLEGSYGDAFYTTKLGEAWVQMLCDTPPPLRAFVDRDGKVITVEVQP